MTCGSCGPTEVKPSTCHNCTACVPCILVVPVVPECRKSIKDDCRVKPLPICRYQCPPPPCVRRTKCHLPSIRDDCRKKPPCPEPVCCVPDCNVPVGCKCVGVM